MMCDTVLYLYSTVRAVLNVHTNHSMSRYSGYPKNGDRWELSGFVV
jgi:hypothetical protein